MSGARGQALVEFALVLPLLLIAVFSVVALAELGVARLALEHAAAEGARAGALTNDDRIVRETVAATVSPLDPRAVAVEIVPPASDPARGPDARGLLLSVRVRSSLRSLPFSLVPLELRASAARRIEWTP